MSENVYTAINAVMREVGYVQKGGKMQYGDKYTYAKESDFIAAVRPLLVEHGVVVFPSGVLQLNQDTYPTNRGGEMNRDTAIIRFHFHHGASDTGFDVEVLGQGADSGDKSANKAMTAALKYALRQALLIETGDDPDDTASAQNERASKKPASNGNQRQPVSKPAAQNNAVREIMAIVDGIGGDLMEGGEVIHPKHSDSLDWMFAKNWAEFNRAYAEAHPYFKSAEHVFATIKKLYGGVPKFGDVKDGLDDVLSKYASREADEAAA